LTQSTDVTGDGNVVVQIVGEGNAVTVGGERALRLVRYDGPVFAEAPVEEERKGEPGWTATRRRETKIMFP
jgi:hypothetical protein